MKEDLQKIYNITDLQFIISWFCPGRCKNCGIWKFKKEEITKGEIDLDYYEKVLKAELLKNVRYIILTGGEVHLSPKYTEVVKLIGKYKPEAFIHTNISGWYPEVHERVVKEVLKYISKENYRIDISLDGSKVNYEKIRLVPNGYEKAIETAKRLKKYGIHLRFIMTIYKENYKDIDFIVELAKSLGIGFYFEFPRVSSFLNNLDKKFTFSQEELDFIEERLNYYNFLNREDRKIKWIRAKNIYQGNNIKFECLAGKESLVIDPYGNVYPCLEIKPQIFMGALKDFNGDLDKLLSSKRAFDVIKIIENKKCQPCTMLCVHKLLLKEDKK